MEVKEVSIGQEKIIHSEEPKIYTISNFITEEEANHFVEVSKPKMKRSVVSDEKKGTVSKGRTGENCWLQHYTDEITGRVANRIADLIGMPVENAESYQVVYYNTTQKYDQHYDAYHKNDTDKSKRCLRQGGQRVITALCYLNDVEEGGHTAFPNINLKVQPEKRKLVIFHNCYPGTTNVHINSLHAGTAPTKGEKYAFNLWFREQAVHKIYEYNSSDFLNAGPLPPAELKSQIENKIDNIVPPKPPVIEDNVIELNSSEKEMKINMISESPFIAEINNGLTGDECKTIRDACTNGKKQNQLRISYWVNNKKDEIKPIVEKIASFMNVESKYFENINVMQYPEGSCHGDHFDSFDLSTDKGKEYSQCRGQRIYTVIGFINNNKDKSGGNIRFIKFNKDITHEEGKLVIYKNMLDVSEIQFQRNDKLNYAIRPIKTGELHVFYMYLRVKDTKENAIPLPTILQIDNKLKSININPNVFENKISDQLSNNDIEKQLQAINAQLEILSKQPKQVKVEEVVDTKPKMTEEEIEREKEKKENFHQALVNFYDKVVVDKTNVKVDNRRVTPEGLFKFRRCVPEKDPALLEFFYTLRNSVPQKGILNYDNFKKSFIADEYNPCVVEKVFEPTAQEKIREYFHWAIDNKKYTLGDSQSNRFKAHNDFMTRILHYEALPLMEHILKKELVPTYTYLSCYIRDCELPAHTDRSDCEYTVSYIIDKPEGVNWNIYVDMEKQPLKSRGRYRQYVNADHMHNCKAVDCGPGGLMMFNGIDHIHFRNKLDGDFYYIILLHYRSKHSTYADTYK
tara:strand:- start:307 stop:2703 length:2397 start_codon:yes stop_codon:yes gene_type:complete